MKKFAFTLQPVLDLFLHREEEAENRLHRFLGIRADLEEKRRRTERLLAEGRLELSTREGLYSDEILLYGNHFRGLELRLERADTLLRELDREIEAVRAELVEVRKKRRMLEKLKERRLRNYTHRVERLEQSEADDLHLTRPPRR